MIKNPFYGPSRADDRISYPDFDQVFQKLNNSTSDLPLFSLKDLSIDIVPDAYIIDDPNSSVHDMVERIDDSDEILSCQSPDRNKLSYQRFLCHDAIECEEFWEKLRTNTIIHASPAIRKYEKRVDHIVFTPQKSIPLPKPPPSLQKSHSNQSKLTTHTNNNNENIDDSNITSPILLKVPYNSHTNMYPIISGFPSPIIASPLSVNNQHNFMPNHTENIDFIDSPPFSPTHDKSLLSPPKRIPRYEREKIDKSCSFNLSPNHSNSLVKQLITEDDISFDASNASRRLNFDDDDDDDDDVKVDINSNSDDKYSNNTSNSNNSNNNNNNIIESSEYLNDSLNIQARDCSLELSHSTTSRSPQLEFSVSEVRSFSPNVL